MTLVNVSGLDKTLKNLNETVEKIEGKTLKGLIRAVIEIRRTSNKDIPKIPVDTGNLRASWFTVTSKGSIQAGASPNFKGDGSSKLGNSHSATLSDVKSMKVVSEGPFLLFGYSAYYAVYVHEAVEKTFNREGAGALFLQTAIDNNWDVIIGKIAKEAKI